MSAARLAPVACVRSVLAGALLLAACGKPAPAPEAAPAPQEAAPAAPAASPAAAAGPDTAAPAAALPAPATAAAAPAAAPAAPAAPALTEAEVRGLLEQWLQAQNSGDAAAYQKLYAERMTGIKRVGPKVRQYDRKRWMADRVPRFAKKQEVTATDVQILRSGALAQVQFVQTYATGNFQDKGNKVLLVVREAGGARIAREEMLDSTVLGEAALPPVLPPQQLAFAVTGGDAPWLMLGKAEAADASGDARLAQRDGPWAAVRGLAPAAATALAGWNGRAVIGYAASGEVCRGQVAELGVVTRVVPHFGTVQDWQGTDGGPKADDAAIATALVELGGAGVRAGKVTPAAGQSCKDARWFRGADAPEAKPLAKSTAVDAALLAAATAALQRDPAYAALQKDYATEVADPKPAQWWAWEDKAEAVLLTGNGKTYLAVHKRAGDFCGGFGAELGAIWQVVQDGPKPVLQLLAVGPQVGPVEAALDADGDGEAEFVIPLLFEGTELWRKVGPTWKAVDTHDVPYLDCPC